MESKSLVGTQIFAECVLNEQLDAPLGPAKLFNDLFHL